MNERRWTEAVAAVLLLVVGSVQAQETEQLIRVGVENEQVKAPARTAVAKNIRVLRWQLQTPGYTFDAAKGIDFKGLPRFVGCKPAGADYTCGVKPEAPTQDFDYWPNLIKTATGKAVKPDVFIVNN